MQNLATSHNPDLISAKTTGTLALDPTDYTQVPMQESKEHNFAAVMPSFDLG